MPRCTYNNFTFYIHQSCDICR